MAASETGERPTLKRELLINLGLLVAAALTLAIGTALLVGLMQPSFAVGALVALVAGDVAVVFVFGRYLLDRLVLRPMAGLTAAANELAAGNLSERARPAETRDFTELAERFNAMTERLLDAQSQLVRTEKLATVGRFAAGVAHQVGNPLSAIGTYLEVLQQRGADSEIVAAASREAARIDRIVRGLLDYARPGDERLGAVDLEQVIRGVHELLEHQGALRDLTITVACEPGVPLVRGNAHALEQVVVNLLLNAADAARGGRAVVGAVPWAYRAPDEPKRRRSDPGLPGTHAPPERDLGLQARRPWRPELEPGRWGALLYVADSGPGVPAEDRERVFDPFFTTKPPGSGTGLGLAVVQRTVHQCGGVVWVETGREGGAAFKVFLPEAGP
ncbi:MAG: HAMP domain-containing histidine kinase [Gemmatimonadetes bacterium]|nr:HAMP domain-containing histidine kinase [Gemmatimonadota bacterium]